MKQKQKLMSYVVFSLISFVAISFVLLSYTIPNSYAHENVINIDIAGACTFSTGGGNYNVSMVDGSTEINANSITTTCNDASGYAIYAVGYSGDSDTGNNTDLIHSTNNSYNIKTDGSSSTGSNWKLKFTVVSDATIAGSYNTYQNIPSTYTKVASYNSSTASGIITPHYQINLAGIQQPGTYTGQVKYVLVHPSTSSISTYSVSFNNNGGTGTMSNATNIPTIENYTIPTSTLISPTGYSFNGWCTVQDTSQTPQTTCSGTTYADGEVILANTIASGNTLNLYAIWSANTYSLTVTFAGTGVDNVKVCAISGDCTGTDLKGTISTSGDSVSGLVYGTAYYLYPSFDSGYVINSWAKTDSATNSVLSSTSASNPTYTIGAGNGAVTATGKINSFSYNLTFNGNGGTPSTSSLSGTVNGPTSVALPTATYRQSSYATLLGWSTSASATTATYSDSINITSSTTRTLYAVWSFNSGTLQNTSTTCGNNMVDARTGVSYLTATISNKCYMEQNLYIPTRIVLYPSDSHVYSSYTMTNIALVSGNSFTDPRINVGNYSDNTYDMIGTWFNYCAASAGTVCSETQSNASYDVCPKGWRLPTSSEMTSVMNANRSNWKVYAGSYRNGTLRSSKQYGYFWSSTAADSQKHYALSAYVYGGLSVVTDMRYYGSSVRCVRS